MVSIPYFKEKKREPYLTDDAFVRKNLKIDPKDFANLVSCLDIFIDPPIK